MAPKPTYEELEKINCPKRLKPWKRSNGPVMKAKLSNIN
jgi:hypothetical protein